MFLPTHRECKLIIVTNHDVGIAVDKLDKLF